MLGSAILRDRPVGKGGAPPPDERMRAMENPAQKSYQLYIDGQWVDASDGGTLDVFCPANGEQLSTIADATKEDVDRAVDAAWKAFETWGKTCLLYTYRCV